MAGNRQVWAALSLRRPNAFLQATFFASPAAWILLKTSKAK